MTTSNFHSQALKYFSLWPFNAENITFRNKCLSMWFIIFLIVCYIWNMYFRVKYVYRDADIITITDWILQTTLVVVSVCFVVNSIYLHQDDIRTLSRAIGANLKVSENSISSKSNSRLVYVMHGSYCLQVFLQSYLYGVTSPIICSVTFPNHLYYYLVLLTTLQINNVIDMLRNQMVALRQSMQEERTTIEKIWYKEVNPYIVLAVYDKIGTADDFLKYLVTVCRGIISFNHIYGIQILGLCSIILFSTSDQVKVTIYSLTSGHEAADVNNVIIVKSIICCNLMICAFLVVRPSIKMTQEVEEVVSACHKFLGSIPLGTDSVSQRFLVKKIYFLTAQLRHHAPYFTASDMFEINYGMILRIIAGVISFTVVYIHVEYNKT